MSLYSNGEIEALIFLRVDRETRFIFGSMPLLAEVVKSGLLVYFAREGLNDIEIQDVIPLELALPTTGQTSGCLISCTYDWPSGKEVITILPK